MAQIDGVCARCNGFGTLDEPVCPRGCFQFGRGGSCLHEVYRTIPCPSCSERGAVTGASQATRSPLSRRATAETSGGVR